MIIVTDVSIKEKRIESQVGVAASGYVFMKFKIIVSVHK